MADMVQGKATIGEAFIELAKRNLFIPTATASLYTIFVALASGQSVSSYAYLPELAWYLKLPFVFLASWTLAFVLLRVFALFDESERADLIIVCAGGAVGGFILKFAVLLIDVVSRPAIPFDHAVSALLGAICAGFTIFTISDTERKQKARLFFLSVAAGLAFPTIVLTTLEFEKANVAMAEEKASRASDLASNITSDNRIKKDDKNEIAKLDGEIASSVNEIRNATDLPIQEKFRQLEKLDPIVSSAFEGGAIRDSKSVKAIADAKKALGTQARAQVEAETGTTGTEPTVTEQRDASGVINQLSAPQSTEPRQRNELSAPVGPPS